MAIPTYEDMLRPILAMAEQQDISRRSVVEPLVNHFKLSTNERAERIPSGQSTYVQNRAGWAMTFLTKASLIDKVAPRTYRITDRGRAFLEQYPDQLTVEHLKALPDWHDAWRGADEQEPAPAARQAVTPQETLDRAIRTLNVNLKGRLLQTILDQTPTFFEQLVLDVLIAMGYGGARADAAEHLGRSNDEGVDGRINQDQLGLDQILVQAKRDAPNRPIDRQTIQAFDRPRRHKGHLHHHQYVQRQRPRVRATRLPHQSGADRRRRTAEPDAARSHRRASRAKARGAGPRPELLLRRRVE